MDLMEINKHMNNRKIKPTPSHINLCFDDLIVRLIRLPLQLIMTIIVLPMLFLWFLCEMATNSNERLYISFLEDIWN